MVSPLLLLKSPARLNLVICRAASPQASLG
eukprot:COSAG05_NODE_21414_length_272_cov_0.595376_1_plen_29_part_01